MDVGEIEDQHRQAKVVPKHSRLTGSHGRQTSFLELTLDRLFQHLPAAPGDISDIV